MGWVFQIPALRLAYRGEAWWTERACLTINRRSLKPSVRLGNAQVAQLVEHATENRSVGGSIPPLGTIKSILSFAFIQIWHARSHASVARAWIRNLIVQPELFIFWNPGFDRLAATSVRAAMPGA
jgi:hypothetical protein